MKNLPVAKGNFSLEKKFPNISVKNILLLGPKIPIQFKSSVTSLNLIFFLIFFRICDLLWLRARAGQIIRK